MKKCDMCETRMGLFEKKYVIHGHMDNMGVCFKCNQIFHSIEAYNCSAEEFSKKVIIYNEYFEPYMSGLKARLIIERQLHFSMKRNEEYLIKYEKQMELKQNEQKKKIYIQNIFAKILNISQNVSFTEEEKEFLLKYPEDIPFEFFNSPSYRYSSTLKKTVHLPSKQEICSINIKNRSITTYHDSSLTSKYTSELSENQLFNVKLKENPGKDYANNKEYTHSLNFGHNEGYINVSDEVVIAIGKMMLSDAERVCNREKYYIELWGEAKRVIKIPKVLSVANNLVNKYYDFFTDIDNLINLRKECLELIDHNQWKFDKRFFLEYGSNYRNNHEFFKSLQAFADYLQEEGVISIYKSKQITYAVLLLALKNKGITISKSIGIKKPSKGKMWKEWLYSVFEDKDLNFELILGASSILFDNDLLTWDFVNCCIIVLHESKKNQKQREEQRLRKELLNPYIPKKEIITLVDIDLMTGSQFELFLKDLFEKQGYDVKMTAGSGDQGVDLILKKNNIVIGVQAKCYSNSVGNAAVQQVVAGKAIYKADKVMVVTNNYFTSSAIELSKANNVILWDRDELWKRVEETINT